MGNATDTLSSTSSLKPSVTRTFARLLSVAMLPSRMSLWVIIYIPKLTYSSTLLIFLAYTPPLFVDRDRGFHLFPFGLVCSV